METGAAGRRATVWVTVEKIAQQAVWLLLFLIMAPILGPRPYGQFALVMVFIGFCELILVDAMVEALVSLAAATRDHRKTASLANTAMAGLAALAAWLLAEPFARLFDDPELGALLRALTPLPILSALTVVPISLLRRRMAFRPLALRSILGLTAGGIVGVAAAATGHGLWALVLQVLVQRGVELAVLWCAEPHAIGFGWAPACFADMAGFARNVVIGRAMYWVSGQAPRLILGYALGPTELGLFTLASRAADAMIQMMVTPRTIVARVELMDDRANPLRFQARLEVMVRDVALVAFPTIFGAAAIMPQLFALALDPRWRGGIAATQLMLLTAVPMVGYFFCTAGLLAANQPSREARIAIWQSGSNVLLTTLVAAFGVTATAAAMLFRLIVMLPLALRNLGDAAGISPWEAMRAAMPILAAAALMGAATYGTGQLVPLPGPPLLQLVILVAEGAAIYVAAIAGLSPRLVQPLIRSLAAVARRAGPR